MQEIACRWAPSLGELEATHQEIWGTVEYDYEKHRCLPCVFFGLYDLRDYVALWRHRGRKWVLWAGSDLRNLRDGFAFNDGKLKWLSLLTMGVFTWWTRQIIKQAENWVENTWESEILASCGINSYLCPSFLGHIKDYDVSFRQGNKVYISSGSQRQIEYGFGTIEDIAAELPEIDFHLYGAEWKTKHPNVIVHGRVPKDEMNHEIREMQCGLRLNKTDGFSEVTAKSILWGQYPITFLPNSLITCAPNREALIRALKQIPLKTTPNPMRSYYLDWLNKFPWNVSI